MYLIAPGTVITVFIRVPHFLGDLNQHNRKVAAAGHTNILQKDADTICCDQMPQILKRHN